MPQLTKEQTEQVINLLSKLLKLAVKATIDKQGYFSVVNESYMCLDDEDEDCNYYVGKGDRFSEEIVARYQIQVRRCYQSETYATDHTLVLELKGRLADVFTANEIETEFEVWMENGDGEPEQTIYDANGFWKDLHFPTFHSLEKTNIKDVDIFLEEISKPFIFELLKN